ncbi:MAG: hypothetical protein GX608_04785 [Lentisphaerae bacterium]|nr:hypothetical protein [Lentisphaerota bacterium]
MKNFLILNRDFQPPADGWYHLAVPGEIPHAESGLVQVLDAQALASIVNRFRADAESLGERFAGLLVDYDHFSLDTQKPSEAAGWIMDLQNRADGLWGQIRWSDSGEAAVKGGRYRFLSPVWNRGECETLAANKVRPLRLANAAVTNDPNFKGLCPLSNRQNLDFSAIGRDEKTPRNRTMDYKAILITLLGLAPDATDEAIQQAVDAKAAATTELQNRAKEADTLKAKVKQLEDAALADKAEAALTEFAGVITNREDVKAGLLANFDATLKVLRGLKPAKLPNRRDGQLPTDGADGAKSASLAARIRNRAKEIQRATPGLSFTVAFGRAAAEVEPQG